MKALFKGKDNTEWFAFMHVNHYKIIESISETSGYEEKSIMEIEWVRIAYSKWRCFCYIHGGMIVKNKESGVREQKIGWN